MFKQLFSIKGRIRRLEYALSLIIFYAFLILSSLLLSFFFNNDDLMPTSVMLIWFCICVLPAFAFMITQACKRSHDIGNSGFYIFIPFYALWLMFAPSEYGINKYGPNPKNIGNYDILDEIGNQSKD